MHRVEETAWVEVPERLERRDAAEHRRRILQEARRLFTEQGVEAVSMHAIAQAAGVGQGTLYRRYANKGELCFDLMRESALTAIEEMAQYLEMHAALPPLQRLDGVLDRILTFTEEKLPLLAAIHDAYCGEHRNMQFTNPFYRWLHGRVASLLTEAVTSGAIRPLDPVFTADALLAALSAELYVFQREQRGLSREAILAGARRLYTG